MFPPPQGVASEPLTLRTWLRRISPAEKVAYLVPENQAFFSDGWMEMMISNNFVYVKNWNHHPIDRKNTNTMDGHEVQRYVKVYILPSCSFPRISLGRLNICLY